MNEENRFSKPARDLQTNQRRTTGKVGLRGCWELLIKVIILIILILILLAYWASFGPFGQRGNYDPWAWLILLLLILLLIYLIWRQKHFVMLQAELTQPSGCKHGDTTISPSRTLERIIGTASGLGFSRYELELVYHTTVIPAGIVYADGAGNPDTTLSFGNHQVTSGTLGFVDIFQAKVGAGLGFIDDTNFEVRLHVIGIDSSHEDRTIAFSISSARCFIQRVGAGWPHDYGVEDDPLCGEAPPTGHPIAPCSVGGGISIFGAANIYGCADEKITEMQLWAIPDPTHTFAQPADGDPIPVPAGTPISNVVFSDDIQRDRNTLDADTDEGVVLSFAPGWGTRKVWISFSPPFFVIVPDLKESKWSGTTGKYTLLLAIKDDAGHTYFDIQRVWRDDSVPQAQITSIGGLTGCLDLPLSLFKNNKCAIEGIAWDRAIRAADAADAATAGRPNDTFGGYSLGYQKNGVPGSGSIPPAGTHRVPDDWTDDETRPLTDAALLAEWDIIAAIDNGAAVPPAGSHKLQRGTRCAYNISLSVGDLTLRGDGGGTVSIPFNYAINIINDLS